MLRRTALIGVLATAAIALSACSGGSNGDPATGEVNPDATLDVGLVLEPTSLDIRHQDGAALDQILIDNIYQGLVRRTPDAKIEPSLATDYTISDDGLVYDFTLADGVTFHDGSALTADDVVASLTEAQTDEGINGHEIFADVDSVASPDADTVEITLAKPNQDFLFNLTGPGGLIFKQDDDTDLTQSANGTGPFVFADWKQKDSITFDRFDDYWGEPAGVATVVFHYIPDFNAGISAALGGDVQVLTAVDSSLQQRFEGSEFELTVGKTTDKATLAFNNAKAPLDDERVRRALRLAVNHDAMLEALGGGTALYGPIPELDPGYEDLSDLVPYDTAEAKRLLDEAGVKDLTLTLTIPSFYSSTISQVLISDFKKIGVTLDVESVEFATWLDEVYTNKDYDLSFVLHVESHDFGSWADPEYYFNYDSPEVQRLYAESNTALDPEESASLRAQAARIVSEDSAADWLYVGDTITAVLPEVHGFPVDSLNSRVSVAGVTVSE